jgi:3-deoxy-D-arabino-heptulosonate 7-phosphate (DAHP) synthase
MICGPVFVGANDERKAFEIVGPCAVNHLERVVTLTRPRKKVRGELGLVGRPFASGSSLYRCMHAGLRS